MSRRRCGRAHRPQQLHLRLWNRARPLRHGHASAHGGGLGEEILCGVDEDAEDIEFYAEALEAQLDPEATDVTTDEPVGEVFASAQVDTLEGTDDYAARAVLTMADGAEPGAAFRGFDVGSVETFFGIQGPGSGVPADP